MHWNMTSIRACINPLEKLVRSGCRNPCAIVVHLCLDLDPFLCPYIFLCPVPGLYPCLYLYLCRGSGGSCGGCVQDTGLCAVFVLEHAGDACAAGCVHCAPAHRLLQHVVGCFHGDGGGGDDCCYGDGGYGPVDYNESPPLPPLRPPVPPPSPQAGACGEASGCNPCSTAPCQLHLMFDCAG